MAEKRPTWPEGVTQLGVTDENKQRLIFAVGFVHLTTFGGGGQNLKLQLPPKSRLWDLLFIAGIDGIGYPVWLPQTLAERYRQDDLVRFVCRLVFSDAKWHLIGLRATVIRDLIEETRVGEATQGRTNPSLPVLRRVTR